VSSLKIKVSHRVIVSSRQKNAPIKVGAFLIAGKRAQASNLPPALSHSALVRLTQPFPAQEFCPAQLVVAVAQALVPLQELTLKHLPAVSPADALIGATANMAAAAAARVTPVVFLAVIIYFSSS
jgi:hypothetical protein